MHSRTVPRLSILKDAELNDRLWRQGYVRIPLLNPGMVQDLSMAYSERFSNRQAGGKRFHTTYESVDPGLIHEVADVLMPVFDDKLSKLTHGLFPVGHTYMVKECGPSSETPLHQDVCLVDEHSEATLTVWVPLTDCDGTNGCLQFVPGSHHLFHGPRPLGSERSGWEMLDGLLRGLLTSHTIGAGEAFIFFNSIVHGSPPNMTVVPRVAVSAVYSTTEDGLGLLFDEEGEGLLTRYSVTPGQLRAINSSGLPDRGAVVGRERPRAIPSAELVTRALSTHMLTG